MMNNKVQELTEKCNELLNILGDDYLKYFIVKLIPIISNCDNDKLDINSTIDFNKKEKSVFLQLIPNNFPDAFACIYLNDSQMILSFAESEIAETHTKDQIDNDLINEFIDSFELYLKGIKIKEYLNFEDKKVKREYFYKDGQIIGTSTFHLFSDKKIKNIKDISINFYKKE